MKPSYKKLGLSSVAIRGSDPETNDPVTTALSFSNDDGFQITFIADKHGVVLRIKNPLTNKWYELKVPEEPIT